MVLAAYGRPDHLRQVLRIRPTRALILPPSGLLREPTQFSPASPSAALRSEVAP